MSGADVHIRGEGQIYCNFTPRGAGDVKFRRKSSGIFGDCFWNTRINRTKRQVVVYRNILCGNGSRINQYK